MNTKRLDDPDKMDEDLQHDTADYVDPVIVKIPLKTPEDALCYWNRRLETVRHNKCAGLLHAGKRNIV